MVLDTWRYQILCVYLQLVNRKNLGEVSFTAKVYGTGDAINPTSHDANGASFTGLNVAADVRSDIGGSLVRDDSETVFQFKEHFGVIVIDRERAAVSMEEVVAQRGVELVVEGVVGTEAVINAAFGNIAHRSLGEALPQEHPLGNRHNLLARIILFYLHILPPFINEQYSNLFTKKEDSR